MIRRALALALLLLLVACSGGAAGQSWARGQLLAPPVRVTAWEHAQIDQVAEALGVQELAGAARCDVRLFSINYGTVGVQAEPGANASAALLLPQPPGSNTGVAENDACTGELPLLAYARGTEVDRNRTLASADDFETSLLLAFFAAQGYAVVATDYLGYAASDYPFHPYLHADSEASTVLDSIVAARTAVRDEAGREVAVTFLAGYSQGGHASMAAQRAAEQQGAGGDLPPIAAAAHLAGLYDLDALLQQRQAWPGYRLIVPFLLTAWQKVYGGMYARATDAFKPPYAAGMANLLPAAGASLPDLVAAGLLPAGAPEQARTALMQPTFLRALQSDTDAPARVAARRNSLMHWRPRAPVLLCGASDDRIVPPRLHQMPLAAQWRAQGVPHLASVDVAPGIRARHGAAVAQSPPANAADAIEAWGAYHGVYQPPLCLAAARSWFERAR